VFYFSIKKPVFLFRVCFFLFKKKTFIIYWLGQENHSIMLICELIFSLDNKWTNKIILPVPDNSVCFVLFQYMSTSVILIILRYVAYSRFWLCRAGEMFVNVFFVSFLLSDIKHVFNVFFLNSHIHVFTTMT